MKYKIVLLGILSLSNVSVVQAKTVCSQADESLLLARQGGGVANGGDGYEIDFCHYATEFKKWVERNRLKNVELPSGKAAETSTLEVLKRISTATVEFTDQEIVVDGEVRTCENIPVENRIRCNYTAWNREGELVENGKTKKELGIRYLTTSHEYLGLAGLEKNIDGNSTSFVSSQLPKFFEEEKVIRLRDVAQEQVSYMTCYNNEQSKFHAYMQTNFNFWFRKTYWKIDIFPSGQGYITKQKTALLRGTGYVAVRMEKPIFGGLKRPNVKSSVTYAFSFENKSKNNVDPVDQILKWNQPVKVTTFHDEIKYIDLPSNFSCKSVVSTWSEIDAMISKYRKLEVGGYLR